MWPMRSEMTRDECRKCLRCLELDAYGSMVSVLRAQGPFTNEKQKLLQELAKVLHISNERHRAEIRRAVNDEKLATIAEQLNGPNTGTDWTIEGRRTIPLLPRLKARSVFTTLANSLSLATAAANEKKPSQVASENSIAIETESQPEVKIEKDLLDTKLCSLENDCNNSEILHENSNLAEEEETDDKDMIDKVIEKPKVSKKPEKRKLSPLLSIGPPNKIQVISALNNTLCISEDKHTLQTVHKQLIQAIPHTEYAGVISLKPNDENSDTMDTKDIISEDSSTRTTVSLNKHVVTSEISMCTNTDWSNLKMLTNTMQNKISTKVVPAVSSGIALSTPLNKMHSESKDLQHEDNINNTSNNTSERSDNTSSNSCKKRLMASIIHEALVPNSQVQITPVVYPNTTVVAVSSGPGPPQVKQTSTTLMCKKLPPEQIAINHQSTAKTGVTINSKKIVNMSHYPNTKLNAKTNVIVIQKGHAQGVTLSHAGKEVLGKVIMGGKNLCVTSQHNNANSISVQSHHISLNNGDQTKTVLPIINSSQNAESAYKLENISFKQVVDVSANLRHDSNKNKLFSSFQFLERAAKLHVQHKTVIQNMNTVQLKECSNVANTIDRDSPLKTDSAITSTTEEKQHKRNKDASMNCQAIKSLDSSKLQGNKEIFIRPKQIANIPDDASNDIRIENSDEDVEITGDMIDLTNPQHLKYILQEDNYKNCVLEDSRSMATINQLDEHDDS